MSFISDLGLDEVLHLPQLIVHGTISAFTAYGVTSLLAGRSVLKLGILIAAGTNPVTAAIAAAAGIVAFFVFRKALKYEEMNKTSRIIFPGALYFFVIHEVLSGSLTETLVIGGTVVLANLIFIGLFEKH